MSEGGWLKVCQNKSNGVKQKQQMITVREQSFELVADTIDWEIFDAKNFSAIAFKSKN